jgi:hypothetical protein
MKLLLFANDPLKVPLLIPLEFQLLPHLMHPRPEVALCAIVVLACIDQLVQTNWPNIAKCLN